MELNKQVCSLELAKKLKELGVKQESLYYWNALNQKPRLCSYRSLKLYEGVRLPVVLASNDIYSAFTVAELGEMLKTQEIDYWYSYPDWRLKRAGESTSDARDENEANARAEMLVYLLENNLLTL